MHTYNIHDRIGRGGMAEIFLAIQTGLGGFERLVVFKRIAPFARVDDEYVRSFMREARVAATMNHPNIVTTLDVGEDEEGPYLVMEYLSGEPLSFVLNTLRQREMLLPVPLACQIAASVASALDFVHHLTLPDGTPWRVVHRDVSPANVMCCYNGQVKLLDFGVAKIAEEEGTKIGMVKGKPPYMSPEQVLGLPLEPRSDVFQLGILCWEMLTGKRLFSRDTAEAVQEITNGKIQAPSRVEPSVPPELDDLVMWALAHEIEQRCPSARAFSDRLLSFRQDLFGTMSGRLMQKFMTQTFDERHAQRVALEQRIRQNPERLSDSIEVIPSITSYTTPSSHPSRPAPAMSHPAMSHAAMSHPALAAPLLPADRESRPSNLTAVLAMAMATITALLALIIAVLVFDRRGEPAAPSSGLDPIVTTPAPEPLPPAPAVTAPSPPPTEPTAPTTASRPVARPEPPPAPAEEPPLLPLEEDDEAPEPEAPGSEEEEDSTEKIDRLTDNLDPWGNP